MASILAVVMAQFSGLGMRGSDQAWLVGDAHRTVHCLNSLNRSVATGRQAARKISEGAGEVAGPQSFLRIVAASKAPRELAWFGGSKRRLQVEETSVTEPSTIVLPKELPGDVEAGHRQAETFVRELAGHRATCSQLATTKFVAAESVVRTQEVHMV